MLHIRLKTSQSTFLRVLVWTAALSVVPAFALDRVELNREAEQRVGALSRGEALLTDPEIQKSGVFFTPENSRIIIFGPWENVSKLLKSGMKNLHETGSSRGHWHSSSRKDFENTMLQENLSKTGLGDAFRPKYGIVLNSMTEKLISPSAQYGSVAWILKPEVFRRSTWSHVDSLELQHTENDALWPKKFAIPYDERAFPPIGWAPTDGGDGEFLNYGETHKEIFYEDARYVEAQVWGALGPEDVEQVVYVGKPDTKAVKALETAGIRVSGVAEYGLEPIRKQAGIPDGKFPLRGEKPLSAASHAIQRPLPRIWGDEDVRYDQAPSPEAWFKGFDRDWKAFLKKCGPKFQLCDEYELHNTAVVNRLNHPYMGTSDGMKRLAEIYEAYRSAANPRSSLDQDFARALVRRTFPQLHSLSTPEGRALLERVLDTLDPKNPLYFIFLSDFETHLLTKYHLWVEAPELGAKFIRAQDFVSRTKEWRLTDFIGHSIFSFADRQLSKLDPEWPKIRAERLAFMKGKGFKFGRCTSLLRP